MQHTKGKTVIQFGSLLFNRLSFFVSLRGQRTNWAGAQEALLREKGDACPILDITMTNIALSCVPDLLTFRLYQKGLSWSF